MRLQPNLLFISTFLEHCSLRELRLCSWVFLVAAVCAHTQNLNEFSGLEKQLNKEVTVETLQGERVTGDLVRVEESRLVLYQGGAPKTISYQSVKTVTMHKSRHTAAWILGISAAGLATGFLIGMTQFDDATNANGKIAGTALAGAAGGAAAGYAISRIGKKEHVIYQSASRTHEKRVKSMSSLE